MKEDLQARSMSEVVNLLEFLDSNDDEFRDETEIRRAQKVLEKTEAKLQRIIVGAPGLNFFCCVLLITTNLLGCSMLKWGELKQFKKYIIVN